MEVVQKGEHENYSDPIKHLNLWENNERFR